MIDVVDALRVLLEPSGSGVKHDDTASQPYQYVDGTIYAWVISHRRTPVGTGEMNGTSELREDFTVRLVYAQANPGEEAFMQRDRTTSIELDDRASSYLTAIALHAQTPPWDSITATVDHDFLRQFAVRGVSVVVSGYRMVPS